MVTIVFERTCLYTFTNWLNYWPSILLKYPSLSWCLQRHSQHSNKLSCCYAWNYSCQADRKCLTVTLTSPSCPSSPFCHCLSVQVLCYKDYLQNSVWLNTGCKLRFPSATRFQAVVTNSLSGVYELAMVILFFWPM